MLMLVLLCMSVAWCRIVISFFPTPACCQALMRGSLLLVVLLFAVVVEKFPLEYFGVKPLSRGI